ncbi:MAG: sugar phosphate isomerase/epimerase [Terrimicrobiaceae bacterium]
MKTQQIAAQLYTCRDLLKTPPEMAKTLARIRAVGYQAVQISGVGEIEPAELKKILDGEGLVCCATHEACEFIMDEPERVVEKLSALGCRHTAYPFPAGVDLSDETSVDAWIASLDTSGAVLAAAGMTLCYHNHNHEFRKLGGLTILEKIYHQTSPGHIKAELDTYWVQYGGGCNVEWISRVSGRMPLIHLKDYMTTAENQPTYCEVGNGVLNFPAIVSAAEEAGCEWFIVEQDVCPGDPVDSLAESFRYLTTHIARD